MTEIDTVVVEDLVFPAAQALLSGSVWTGDTSRRRPAWLELGDIKQYEHLDSLFNREKLVTVAYFHKEALVFEQSGVIVSMDVHRIGNRVCCALVYQYDVTEPRNPSNEEECRWLRLAGKIGAFPDRLIGALKADIADILGIVPELEYDAWEGDWYNV